VAIQAIQNWLNWLSCTARALRFPKPPMMNFGEGFRHFG
jgi:hypothetical protein